MRHELATRIAKELLTDLKQRKGFRELFDSLGTDSVRGIETTWVTLIMDLLPDARELPGTAPRDRLPESYVDGRASRPKPAEVLEDL